MSVLSSLVERAFLRKAEVLALKVVAVRDISPRMKRIRFAGKDIGRFETDENIHARLVFPPAGLNREDWGRTDPDGRLEIVGVRSHYRKYTIRQADSAQGVLDIDFVVHDVAGPGSDFARHARPGDLIGIIGPGGRSIGPADWYLIAGDDAPLPAIARIADMLPGSASGSVLIEVNDRADEIEIPLPPRMSLTWLHRTGEPPGSTPLLPDAVARTQWPGSACHRFRLGRSGGGDRAAGQAASEDRPQAGQGSPACGALLVKRLSLVKDRQLRRECIVVPARALQENCPAVAGPTPRVPSRTTARL